MGDRKEQGVSRRGFLRGAAAVAAAVALSGRAEKAEASVNKQGDTSPGGVKDRPELVEVKSENGQVQGLLYNGEQLIDLPVEKKPNIIDSCLTRDLISGKSYVYCYYGWDEQKPTEFPGQVRRFDYKKAISICPADSSGEQVNVDASEVAEFGKHRILVLGGEVTVVADSFESPEHNSILIYKDAGDGRLEVNNSIEGQNLDEVIGGFEIPQDQKFLAITGWGKDGLVVTMTCSSEKDPLFEKEVRFAKVSDSGENMYYAESGGKQLVCYEFANQEETVVGEFEGIGYQHSTFLSPNERMLISFQSKSFYEHEPTGLVHLFDMSTKEEHVLALPQGWRLEHPINVTEITNERVTLHNPDNATSIEIPLSQKFEAGLMPNEIVQLDLSSSEYDGEKGCWRIKGLLAGEIYEISGVSQSEFPPFEESVEQLKAFALKHPNDAGPFFLRMGEDGNYVEFVFANENGAGKRRDASGYRIENVAIEVGENRERKPVVGGRNPNFVVE